MKIKAINDERSLLIADEGKDLVQTDGYRAKTISVTNDCIANWTEETEVVEIATDEIL